MNTFYYLIEANAYLLVFYAFYRLVLRNETFYTLNRFYLLITSFLSFLLPGIQLSGLAVPEVEFTYAANQPSIPVWTAYHTVMAIYFLVAVFFMLRLGIRLYRISYLIKQGKIKEQDGFRQVELSGQSLPFSFMNYVFINPHMPKIETIIRHERVHIVQQHSADILFFEFLQIMNWFNPLIYWIQTEIKTLHEYVADEKTAAEESSTAEYALFLIHNSYGVPSDNPGNTMFNPSLLKKRIMKLNQKKSPDKARFKYLLVLMLPPLMLCITAMTFAKSYGIVDLMPAPRGMVQDTVKKPILKQRIPPRPVFKKTTSVREIVKTPPPAPRPVFKKTTSVREIVKTSPPAPRPVLKKTTSVSVKRETPPPPPPPRPVLKKTTSVSVKGKTPPPPPPPPPAYK